MGRAADGPGKLSGAIWSRPEGSTGEAYGEQAFRCLLAVEQERAKRSTRPFFLLLIDLKERSRPSARMDSMTGAALFASLLRALRETDFVGWYCQGLVVGAVLTQFEKAAGARIAHVVVQRVRVELRLRLVPDALERLQFRVYQRPAGLKPGK
jgi:hypothetical protein